MSAYRDLQEKIKSKKAIVTVVGLGYVGLPMALEFCKKGFRVNGLDTSKKRVEGLRKGVSYIEDIPSSAIVATIKKGKFNVTDNMEVMGTSDVIIVCVPTPLDKKHKPDISYILSVSRTLKKHMRPGQLVILESTTYPGTTREVMLPVMEKSGLVLGKDFYLVFSPERIDPGNPKYDFRNIPKVVGGMTPRGTELAKLLYLQVTEKVVGVSSTEAAEVTKLLENTFRIVNIGLINEFAALCDKLKIDVWEVVDAAGTKPFGFMQFYPGPGVGGHCIPADPMYLSWKARKVGFRTQMIDLAAKVNRMAPNYVVERMQKILKAGGKQIKGAKILLLGVAYKKDVNDLRESPALDILQLLKEKKAKWSYYDTFIPYLDIEGLKSKPVKMTKKLLKEQDLVVILTDHSNVDYRFIAANAAKIFDTRNALGKRRIKGEHIVKL